MKQTITVILILFSFRLVGQDTLQHKYIINFDAAYTGSFIEDVYQYQPALGYSVGFDYYWSKQENLDWSTQIQQNVKPYLKYYGFARPDDTVEVYNLNRVSEFLYVFFKRNVDKKITLWYY